MEVAIDEMALRVAATAGLPPNGVPPKAATKAAGSKAAPRDGADGDVSSVKGVGKKRADALRRAGCHTVGALAELSDARAEAVATEQGVPLTALLTCVRSARAQLGVGGVAGAESEGTSQP